MMVAVLGARRHRPAGLQSGLDPLIAQTDVVMLTQLITEMRDVKTPVLLLIQPQDLLHGRQRHLPRTGSATPTVEQPIIAALLVALFPAPHGAAGYPQDLRRLPPLEL